MTQPRRRVAVVGSGVSGLVAAWILSRESDVTLYEADDRPGGHADTHDVPLPDGGTIPIDTGFIVHNERTYPTLLRLFDELGVGTQESDMSMSVHCRETGLEYAGALGARGLFPSASNLRDRRYLRMLTEITRFHRMARKVLEKEGGYGTTGGTSEPLSSFLARGGFSEFFATYFMTPLVSAVWSTDPDEALDYPAVYLFRFLEHHGMLSVFGSPPWRTVTGGSREYVERVVKNLHEVRLSTPVTAIREHADGVEVTSAAGTTSYDAVVVATHSDQAVALLADPTPAQRELLGAMPYTPNVAQLHTDVSLLPRSPHARGSWNYQRRGTGQESRVLVTYDMSRLMRLPGWDDPQATRYLVTLGGEDVVDPGQVIETMHYAHPQYTPDSVSAQERLAGANTARIAFAGAYHGWGFHEDGALSGRRAAEHLGADWDAPLAERAQPAAVRRVTATGPKLYETTVRHARKRPLRNVFAYGTYHWLVDLDDLPRFTGALAPVLRRLAEFRSEDHIGDPNRSIRDNIDAFLAEHGIDLTGGRVQMLTNARVLGHVFNPITVYWCHAADGHLAGVVVEVHNTYGGRHAYLVQPDERGRAEVDKALYVSPFNDVSGRYDLVLPVPDEELLVGVTLRREGHPPFVATLQGSMASADNRTVLRSVLRHPLAPLVGALRIRLQGIKLWARGLPVQPRPSTSDRNHP